MNISTFLPLSLDKRPSQGLSSETSRLGTKKKAMRFLQKDHQEQESLSQGLYAKRRGLKRLQEKRLKA
ncbi:MAG: hypothetical protein LBC45_01310 [Chlamydiales bacterium]|nr:hypothetical protein [Chlamydiales bacterium]